MMIIKVLTKACQVVIGLKCVWKRRKRSNSRLKFEAKKKLGICGVQIWGFFRTSGAWAANFWNYEPEVIWWFVS